MNSKKTYAESTKKQYLCVFDVLPNDMSVVCKTCDLSCHLPHYWGDFARCTQITTVLAGRTTNHAPRHLWRSSCYPGKPRLRCCHALCAKLASLRFPSAGWMTVEYATAVGNLSTQRATGNTLHVQWIGLHQSD